MLEPLHIVIDSREQMPWAWDPCDAITEVRALIAGDYALACDVEKPKRKATLCPVSFALERKSLDDFAGTLGSGFERFQKELIRMETWPARIIVVESDFESVCFVMEGENIRGPEHNHPQMTPSFIARRISELSMMNVSVLFAGSAQLASGLALHIFRERRRMIEGI